MSELIEKQKVLDVLREIATEKFSLDDPYGVYINVLMDVEKKICRLPVVQPNGPDNLVKDSQGLAKDLVNDCVSRQAAIDEANAWLLECLGVHKQNRSCGLIRRLEDLPSVQPSSSCSHDAEQLEPAEPFEKCSDCIHDDDSEDICILRRCKHAIAETVECFEPKQPEQRWIPCSERLPGKNCRCLTTNTAWGAFEVDWNVWINGEWLYQNEKPIAWMPLPEPYKEENHD